MKLSAGETGKTRFGEEFGPLNASDGKYAQPLYVEKFGHVFTFHASGRYSNDPAKRHPLDLVAR